MKNIVKVLLQEGISEEVIHEVLSVIEENYEIVDETLEGQIKKVHGEPYSQPGREVMYVNTGEIVNEPATSNKAHKLIKKAEKAKSEELHQAAMKEAGVKEQDPSKWTGPERIRLQDAYDKIKSKRKI